MLRTNNLSTVYGKAVSKLLNGLRNFLMLSKEHQKQMSLNCLLL